MYLTRTEGEFRFRSRAAKSETSFLLWQKYVHWNGSGSSRNYRRNEMKFLKPPTLKMRQPDRAVK